MSLHLDATLCRQLATTHFGLWLPRPDPDSRRTGKTVRALNARSDVEEMRRRLMRRCCIPLERSAHSVFAKTEVSFAMQPDRSQPEPPITSNQRMLFDFYPDATDVIY
jgi:hypothetical protein